MKTIFDDMYTPPKGASFRIKNADGKWLLAPIDGWGRKAPVWIDCECSAALLTKSDAIDQSNFLTWHPHKLAGHTTVKVKRSK